MDAKFMATIDPYVINACHAVVGFCAIRCRHFDARGILGFVRASGSDQWVIATDATKTTSSSSDRLLQELVAPARMMLDVDWVQLWSDWRESVGMDALVKQSIAEAQEERMRYPLWPLWYNGQFQKEIATVKDTNIAIKMAATAVGDLAAATRSTYSCRSALVSAYDLPVEVCGKLLGHRLVNASRATRVYDRKRLFHPVALLQHRIDSERLRMDNPAEDDPILPSEIDDYLDAMAVNEDAIRESGLMHEAEADAEASSESEEEDELEAMAVHGVMPAKDLLGWWIRGTFSS